MALFTEEMKMKEETLLFLKVCGKTCRRNDEAERDADRARNDAALHPADKAERREKADERRRDAQAAQRNPLADRQNDRAEETQQNRRGTLSRRGDISLAAVRIVCVVCVHFTVLRISSALSCLYDNTTFGKCQYIFKKIFPIMKIYFIRFGFFIEKCIYISENVCYNHFNKNFRLVFYRIMQ